MWSVVEFIDDRSVEVVPAYWLNKNKCAWPKKNSKKFIQKRVKPNEIDFDFLKARKLGKDRDNYTLAREKAKKAEYTSDLSTNNDTPSKMSETKNMKSTLNPKKKDKIMQQKANDALWSPSSPSDFFVDDGNFNKADKLADTVLVLSGTPNSPAIKLLPTILSSNSSNISNTDQTTVNDVKKKLNFNKTCHMMSPISTPDKIIEITDLDGVTRFIDESFIGIVNTSSSPFKISNVSKIDLQQSVSTPNESQQISAHNEILEFLHKMNRTICNIKYDINSLNEKVDKMYDILLEPSRFENSSFEKSTENIFQTELSNLPLESEDELDEFERKLTTNKEFRIKLVAELKRFSRSTLPSTVRIIMRQLFKDALLEKYSYKGLKKKKVFYTLATCTVIFDAIKQMKKFKLSDAVDIETPIRTFISGAKFREPKKNLLTPSNEPSF
ncbi:uncharacterized protein LOC132932270 [Rhopalosiphum padi]|uniref:uncharacterized protein LOC132926485 n=1 Tax=Rhopalosiphum padi TaxID=40932 RepID=UPI00298D79EA|nr:uncharacterized protein LOC132926485 [Rhopalosiphum padi]XP_060851277.1 uncharacterized protein LOC132929742 [Rhopalosiphum padi]XP_060854372.1 uncharacterized protein LOC132932153 [Rhopalosiphum padi]XP_060854382.1 uncharacterized protein LOC132932161 [Rhopalosiphum padi]XP_060854539.1 uncharacterized protein LOC132932270 [Rhopalosiphum padi]